MFALGNGGLSRELMTASKMHFLLLLLVLVHMKFSNCMVVAGQTYLGYHQSRTWEYQVDPILLLVCVIILNSDMIILISRF